MSAFAVLAILIVLLLAGLPVAFALGGLGAALLLFNDVPLIMVPQGLYSSIDSFVLLAVPLFILMSNILLKGGVGSDLFRAVQAWVGHWPGGLAVATVISCAIFGAISGSSVATAATIGVIAIPEMIKRGYKPHFVYGLLAAGGTLGILIPPSIPMIVLGVVIEESITSLFLAGIGPGLLMAFLFIGFSVAYAKLAGGFEAQRRATWEERRKATIRALPTLFLALVIILGIYLGVFTPTESAGIGFTLSLLLTTFVLRSLSWASLKEAVAESMRTTVTLMLILAGAKVFGQAITLMRIPHEVSTMIVANVDTAGGFVAIVCSMLLVMGFFLEALAMTIIMAPVLYPTLAPLGLDPIWFGVIFVIMIEAALISPPVGLNLFIIQAIAKASLGEVIRGAWPFILMMLGAIAAIYAWPGIALTIPFKL
ncbi:MAG: TRAP transporter large permease [Pseudomonadota bacterium]